MKKITLVLATAAGLFAASAAEATTYTYVGSWNVGDGPEWSNNPLAYSGTGAAALLFGGNASDYAISTIGTDVSTINHMANYAVIGVGFNVFGESYFRGTEGVTHYQDVYTYDASTDTVSAYVHDFGAGQTNYVFRIDATAAVPEPATWAMMIVGFGLVGAGMRRRTTTKVAYAI